MVKTVFHSKCKSKQILYLFSVLSVQCLSIHLICKHESILTDSIETSIRYLKHGRSSCLKKSFSLINIIGIQCREPFSYHK